MNVIHSFDRTNWAIILRYHPEATALLRASDEVGEEAMHPPKGSPRDLITPGINACERLIFAEVLLPSKTTSIDEESIFPLKERLPLSDESGLSGSLAKAKDCTQEGVSFPMQESLFLSRVMGIMQQRAGNARWLRKHQAAFAPGQLDLLRVMKRQIDAYDIGE